MCISDLIMKAFATNPALVDYHRERRRNEKAQRRRDTKAQRQQHKTWHSLPPSRPCLPSTRSTASSPTLRPRRQFDRHVRENGCQPAHDTSGTFPYIDKAVRVLRMGRTGEDLIDDILGGDFKHANTVKFTTIEGSEIIQTLEPANLQAMLATQFKDFETGRFKQFAPCVQEGDFLE